MLTRRTFWSLLIAALLTAGVGATVLKKRAAPAPVPVAVKAPAVLEFLPDDVTQVQLRDLRQVLLLSGSLHAVNQAVVKAKVAGEVREVLVREGETVQSGQVLARIDATEYQARLEQARGSLQAARGQLAIATKARDNNRALVNQGFISQNAFDNAASQYDIARANMASAQGSVDLAQKSMSDSVVRAPISGLIASRSVQPGEKVSIDSRLLDVVDLRQMELEAAVPTTDIMHVALGQEVQVRLEGLATVLTGKVARINPATQTGSRSVLTYIHVDNPQGMLRVGMFGEAQLTLSKKSQVLTVPQAAVQQQAGRPVVYAIENGMLLQKPVTLGIRGDNGAGAAVEILGGLDQGAVIVKSNMGNLPAGTAVRYAQAAPAAALTAASAAAVPATAVPAAATR